MKEYFLKIVTYLIIVFTPITPIIFWLGFFIMLDVATGIIKSVKTKTALTSKKLSNTITKFTLYSIAIIASHILQTKFLYVYDLPSATNLVAGYIAVTEFKSIIENISEALNMPLIEYIKEKLYRK